MKPPLAWKTPFPEQNTAWKVPKYGVFFWSVFSCIRTEYRKIRTRKNSVFGHFSRSEKFWEKFLLRRFFEEYILKIATFVKSLPSLSVNLSLRKICQNRGFMWLVYFPIRENAVQKKLVLWPILRNAFLYACPNYLFSTAKVPIKTY